MPSVLVRGHTVFFFEFFEEKGWGRKAVLSCDVLHRVVGRGKSDLRIAEAQIGQIRGDALAVIFLEYAIDIVFIIGDAREDHGKPAFDVLMRLKAIHDLPKPHG